MIERLCKHSSLFPSWVASFCLSYIILVLFFTNYLNILLPPESTAFKLFQVGSKTSIGLLFLTTFFYSKKYDTKILFFFSICILVIALNMLFFPHLNEFFSETTVNFLLTSSIPFTLVCMVENFDLLYEHLKKISVIISICSIFPTIMVIIGQISLFGEHVLYFMGYGYSCLIPTLILFFAFRTEKKHIYFILFFILVATIILLGSRGPLLPIGIYFLYTLSGNVLKSVKENRKLELRDFFVNLLFITAIVFGSLFFDRILSAVCSFLTLNNINSRTIVSLMNGNLMQSNGRASIYGVLLTELKNDFVSIRGINAEYPIIGLYAHNIVVEILYDFGCVLGGLLLCLLFICVLRTFFAQKSIVKDLAIIFMIASLCQLWNSGSLWTNQFFWEWIGLSFCLTKTLPREVGK